MAASSLMGIGARALTANYAALQVTGNNIANVNTKGYSRQTAEFETSKGQFTGAGFFGKGVNVATVTRSYNEFLTREAANTQSVASSDQVRIEKLKSMETLFRSGEEGIGYAAAQFLSSFVDVSNKPNDGSARQVALSRGEEMIKRIRTVAGELDTLQAGVSLDARLAVEKVNTLAKQVADLNQSIAVQRGSGHTPNDLLDQRDLAINELSKYVQVTTVDADDGTRSVFIGGGQKLVLGNSFSKLQITPDQFDATKIDVSLIESAGSAPRSLPMELLSSGSLYGMLRFQNDDLATARNTLGQLTAGIITRVNTQQSRGLSLIGNPPEVGQSIFSDPIPLVQPSLRNTGGASVGLTITNGASLQASDYELRAHPNAVAGDYMITRLSDGKVMDPMNNSGVINSFPVTMDGFEVSLTGALAPNDKFILQPVGNVARNDSRVMTNPKGIAAAPLLLPAADPTHKGTGAITNIYSNSSTLMSSSAVLRFQSTATPGSFTYRWEDTTGTPLAGANGTPQAWVPGQPLVYQGDPAILPLDDGFSMAFQGVPFAGDPAAVPLEGDTFIVKKNTGFPPNGNGNANLLLGIRDERIIGKDAAIGGLGDTPTDAYANLLAIVGVRVQTAQGASDQSSAIQRQAEMVRASQSAVNLDEEAARLIQFQQSYQAAAKTLQTAQIIFDTLLQATSR